MSFISNILYNMIRQFTVYRHLPVAPKTDLFTRSEQHLEQKLSPQCLQYCWNRKITLIKRYVNYQLKDKCVEGEERKWKWRCRFEKGRRGRVCSLPTSLLNVLITVLQRFYEQQSYPLLEYWWEWNLTMVALPCNIRIAPIKLSYDWYSLSL